MSPMTQSADHFVTLSCLPGEVAVAMGYQPNGGSVVVRMSYPSGGPDWEANITSNTTGATPTLYVLCAAAATP